MLKCRAILQEHVDAGHHRKLPAQIQHARRQWAAVPLRLQLDVEIVRDCRVPEFAATYSTAGSSWAIWATCCTFSASTGNPVPSITSTLPVIKPSSSLGTKPLGMAL